jgi:hypothetical protein
MVTVSVLLALTVFEFSVMVLVRKAAGPPRIPIPSLITLAAMTAVLIVTVAHPTETAGLLMANVKTVLVFAGKVLADVTTSCPTPEVTVKLPCDEVKKAAWAPLKLRVPAEEVVVNPLMVMAVLVAMS